MLAESAVFRRYAKADGRCVGITIFGVRKHLDDGIGESAPTSNAGAFVEELGQAIEAVAKNEGVTPES